MCTLYSGGTFLFFPYGLLVQWHSNISVLVMGLAA
jgi:hypothetical protein